SKEAAKPERKTEQKAAAGEKKLTPQQEKMSFCSKDAKAKGMKGEERKKFMSECLRKK
ncbi:MAG: PsiF repeat protein, partial [Betaproteobacteria bacterium]|nr:PsiF repeat protein [Betaproteobacteria bacterium]